MTLRTALAAAALAVAAAAPATATAADIGLEQRPTNVASYAGNLAWSHYDAATDRYRLMIQRPGQAPMPAPVPDARRPFDVDLGGSRTGSATAVYTRCTTPGAPRGSKDANPKPGAGCDIYRYALGAGAEQHLTQISSPTADERDPTIARGQVAFVRREGRAETIRLGDTTTAGRPTKVLVRVDARKVTLDEPSLAFGPKLPHGSLAYVLYDAGFGFGRQRVRVLDLDARRSVNAYTAQSGGANFANATGPTWDPFSGLLYFARTNDGSGQGNRFVRWSHATHRLSYAQGDPRANQTAWISPAAGLFVADALADDACLGNLNDPPEKSFCRLYTTGPLSFTARP